MQQTSTATKSGNGRVPLKAPRPTSVGTRNDSVAGARAEKIRHSSSVEWIYVADIRIDPAAQRALREPWVKAQVPLFDPDQLGYIVVSLRKDGFYYAIDGQHRVELIRAVGWGDQKVACEVFRGLTQAQEAEVFLKRQVVTPVRTFDKFRVRITAGDPVACDINRIVMAAGLTIHSTSNGTGYVSAVRALERVYRSPKSGPATLVRTLLTIKEAWGLEGANFEGDIIEGIGLVLSRYSSKVEHGALVAKLAKIGGGAPGLLGKARGLRDIRGGTVAYFLANLIVDRYNRGRRAGKVDGW